MTVASTINRKEFTGDGVTVAFATSPMVFFDEGDLEVYRVVTATGVATLLTITTHYTVSGGAGSTGTVTMVTAPTSAQTLVIVRVMDAIQETDFVNNDDSDAEVLEDSLDKGTMVDQQLSAALVRSLHIADSDVTGIDTELPTPVGGALLRVKDDLTGFEMSLSEVPDDPLFLNTGLFIGDTANTKQTIGLTINQGTSADELIAGKASDVSHGMSTETEVDTWFTVTRQAAGVGGAVLKGYSGHEWAAVIQGNASVATTTKSSLSDGPVVLKAALKSGTTIGGFSATDNIVVIKDNATARYVFDAGARLYFLGATSTDIVGNGKWGINEDANANLTIGLTINQGDNDDEILAFKSSDVAHGITDVAETDTYGKFSKIGVTQGGLNIEGFVETGISVGLRLRANATDVSTGKTTGSTASVLIDGTLKSGTGVGSLGANANIVAFRDAATTRFILDSDGDSHQDVGTAWTNFDDHDDIQLLDAMAIALARDGDPLREEFVRHFESNRALIERLPGKGLVSFNDDGHHFVNMSRLTMLHTGAIRQLGEQHRALLQELLPMRAQIADLQNRLTLQGAA